MMKKWISVSHTNLLPEAGKWVNLHVDHRINPQDLMFKRIGIESISEPIEEVTVGQLRDVDSEGNAYWQRGQLASGAPLEEIKNVSMWQELPDLPQFHEAENGWGIFDCEHLNYEASSLLESKND